MFDREIPSATHEVALYGEHFEVRGQLETRPPRRLLDILNDTQIHWLALHEASIRPLAQELEGAPVVSPTLIVDKKEIIVAWLVEEAKVEASEFAAIAKVPRKVRVYAGPFVMWGDFHAMEDATLIQAVDGVREEFFPLTGPSLVSLSTPWLSLEDGLLAAIQRDRVTAVQSGEE